MIFPRDTLEAKVAFYGDPRGENAAVNPEWFVENMTHVVPPFQMTYIKTPIKSITFHKKAAPALLAALTAIWDKCNHSQAEIDRWRLNEFGGSFNYRKIRGSNSISNHSFGIAIDIEPIGNELGKTKGIMPPFAVAAFKTQGFKWGGDYKGRKDWMHFEAVS